MDFAELDALLDDGPRELVAEWEEFDVDALTARFRFSLDDEES